MYVIRKVKDGIGHQYQENIFIAKMAGSGENLFETRSLREALLYRDLAVAAELAATIPGARVFHVTFTPTSKEELENAVHSSNAT